MANLLFGSLKIMLSIVFDVICQKISMATEMGGIRADQGELLCKERPQEWKEA